DAAPSFPVGVRSLPLAGVAEAEPVPTEPAIHHLAGGAAAHPAGRPVGQRVMLFAVHELIAGAHEVPDSLDARGVVRGEELSQALAREIGGGASIHLREGLVALRDPAVPEDVLDLRVFG